MENTNRPIQRVIPIRSEFQNRVDSNLNCQGTPDSNQTRCTSNLQQIKILNSSDGLSGLIDSVPFIQQNVNIMNINLSNNSLIQGVSQDTSNSFSQSSSCPKTYLQLADGRYVQIAQSIQPTQQQMPTTILLQMPYAPLSQSGTNANQVLVNKRNLLPSQMNDKSSQNNRFFNIGNSINSCSNVLVSNQQTELCAKVDAQIKQMELQSQPLNDYQRNMINQLNDVKDQINNNPGDAQTIQNVSSNGAIISLDKYQEICDMLQCRKLFTKAASNEETVLVEFRLNQQKYQLRMTRNQKVDMEKLLISAGNQQQQMEILQVYQSEQRKNLQQRTSVVLNQMINKNPSNIACNSPQIQALNITKPIYPLNSVLMAVSQGQYNDASSMQPSNAIMQQRNVPMQSPVSIQHSNGVIFTTRMPPAQSITMPVSSVPRETVKDTAKQKRITKTPLNHQPNMPNISSNQDMKPARSRRYNNMRKVLLDDQNSLSMPDYSAAFEDLNDVAKRLLPYHLLEECKDQKFDEVDRILCNSFTDLNKKCRDLKRIASSITMRDLIVDKSGEQLLIKRMQLDLERDLLEREKEELRDQHSQEPLPEFDEGGHTVIVIEDSPPPVDYDDEEALLHGAPQSSSISFVDSMQCFDDGENADTSDALLDSLCNYNIEDISNDGEGELVATVAEVFERGPQSQDPDLDAAIKSILF